MWSLDWPRARPIVRIGAHAAEVWLPSGKGGLHKTVSQPLETRGSLFDPAPLASAVKASCANLSRPVELVLESAYVPVMLVDTGGTLWRIDQLHALLRHRFASAYGDVQTADESWTWRTAHRFGDRRVLAFAMPPAVETALRTLDGDGTVRVSSWMPALSWGLRHRPPSRSSVRRGGWWSWQEQDRRLLARVTRTGVTHLHPALSAAESREAEVRSAIETLTGESDALDLIVEHRSFDDQATGLSTHGPPAARHVGEPLPSLA